MYLKQPGIIMRRTKEDAEITRQHLLKAAVKVFSEKGYAATRLSDIAEEANVTRGAIYWHFENKRNLFVALFKERVSPVFNLIDQTLSEDLTPLAKIKKVIAVFFEKMGCDQELKTNQRLEIMEMKLRGDFPEINDYMKANAEEFNKMLLKIIIAGMESGEIRTNISPQSITSAIGTLFLGYGHMKAHEELNPMFKGNNLEVIEIFIRGIRAN
jgi:AcrR family transcriptional regulator